MCGKGIILGLLLIVLSVSCAKPNYQDDPQARPKPPTGPVVGKIARSGELSFPSENLYGDVAWDSRPTTRTEGVLILGFWSADDVAGPWRSPENELSIYLWMPKMGHGSAPAKIERLEDGSIRVSHLYFFMPGQWEIHIQLKRGGETVESKVLDFEL